MRSIGIIRSIALSSAFGRRDAARDEGLPRRQQIEQEIDENARIAADMAAVAQNLRRQFAREQQRGAPQQAVRAFEAKPGLASAR